jgi:hypothetical protein
MTSTTRGRHHGGEDRHGRADQGLRAMARGVEGIERAGPPPAPLVRRAKDEGPGFEPTPSAATETVSVGPLARQLGREKKEPQAGPDRERSGPRREEDQGRIDKPGARRVGANPGQVARSGDREHRAAARVSRGQAESGIGRRRG